MKAPGRTIWSTASMNFKFKNGAVGTSPLPTTSSAAIPWSGARWRASRGGGVRGHVASGDALSAGDYVKLQYTNPVFESEFSTLRIRSATESTTSFCRWTGATRRHDRRLRPSGLEAQKVNPRSNPVAEDTGKIDIHGRDVPGGPRNRRQRGRRYGGAHHPHRAGI